MSIYRLNEDYYEEDYENLNEFRNPFKKKSKTRKALDFAKKHKYAVGSGLFLTSPFMLRAARSGANTVSDKVSQASEYLDKNHPKVKNYLKDLATVGGAASAAGAAYLDAKNTQQMDPVERELH